MNTSDPEDIWLLRHGQSLGNIARELAHESRAEMLDIAERDMDVPLSDLGKQQAAAFGRWLGQQSDPPDVVLSSPYLRAAQTAQIALAAAGLDRAVHLDERLRERELGILDLLTQHGVATRYPVEAERRKRLGKFYHRPPGGESWVDVALRIRSLRDSLAREHLGKRVLMVSHEVVIVIWRYLLDDLVEAEALALSRDHPLANCSLTRYRTGPEGALALDLDAWTAPLEVQEVPVTEEHDAPVAPR
ncbi:MAG: histidine phosphatase family protein [Ilumatobacteraceae bacterium]|nr:histidine phosphatase family protein [Ilumatobacteraceae bacterium]